MNLTMLVYFDADAFHRVADAFQESSLSDGLRAHIAHCQITLLEVLSQLTIKSGDEILGRLQAIRNFTNPVGTALLPWPDDFLASAVSRKPYVIDEANKNARELEVNICLRAQSVDQLGQAPGKIKDELDEYKSEMAALFKAHIEQYRAQFGRTKDSPHELTEIWARGVAKRAGAAWGTIPQHQILTALSALYEFEMKRFEVAAKNLNYDFDKRAHRNDVLDAQRLIYLSDPKLHFVTCDKGYCSKIRKSEQAKRIHWVRPQDLESPQRVEALLSSIVGPT